MKLLAAWLNTLSNVEQVLVNRMIERGDAVGVYVIYKDSESFKRMVIAQFGGSYETAS